MLFPTVAFAVFFAVVLPAHWLLRAFPRLWSVGLVVASLVFYGWWDWAYVPLLVGSIVVNDLLGRGIHRARTHGAALGHRFLVAAGVVGNLLLLAWFKYAGFFAYNVWNPLPGPDVGGDGLAAIVLPVGISFFTFQAISYVIDVGRGEEPAANLLEFAVYLSFFPQLVAGPIVRASELLPQLRQRLDPRYVLVGPGLWLIGAGLFKKVVIASFLADQIVDPVFAVPEAHSGWEVFWGVLGYAVQIYADFSGYTDIAIGVALLLGFRFPQNFDAPYTAASLQDFWRRWHMTLSRWLRDYLYIPLGGNRGGEVATYRNLFLTMVLGGLWHGAAWTFVIWGAIHGTVLGIERRFGTGRASWWSRGRTFGIVCVAWVFFRATDVERAVAVLRQVVTGGLEHAHPGATLVHPLVPVVVVGMIALQFVPWATVQRAQHWVAARPLALQGAAAGAALMVIDALGPEGIAPFIYFRF